jgi:hypothetical protein
MPDMNKEAQLARAQRLREQIEEMKSGTGPPPQNPNEFVHRQMAERDQHGSDTAPPESQDDR